MAVEKWTVFYNVTDGGSQPLANWKAGDIEVKANAKNKSKGLTNESKESTRQVSVSGKPLLTNEVQECRFVTVEGEEEEVCQALRVLYGAAINSAKFLAVKTSSLAEVAAE